MWWREHVGISKAAAESWAREMRREGMERAGMSRSERVNGPGNFIGLQDSTRDPWRWVVILYHEGVS